MDSKQYGLSVFASIRRESKRAFGAALRTTRTDCPCRPAGRSIWARHLHCNFRSMRRQIYFNVIVLTRRQTFRFLNKADGRSAMLRPLYPNPEGNFLKAGWRSITFIDALSEFGIAGNQRRIHIQLRRTRHIGRCLCNIGAIQRYYIEIVAKFAIGVRIQINNTRKYDERRRKGVAIVSGKNRGAFRSFILRFECHTQLRRIGNIEGVQTANFVAVCPGTARASTAFASFATGC